jgi:hypothetical protein
MRALMSITFGRYRYTSRFALDPSSIIHDSLEWDILQIISENVLLNKAYLLVNIMHWQVMVHS